MKNSGKLLAIDGESLSIDFHFNSLLAVDIVNNKSISLPIKFILIRFVVIFFVYPNFKRLCRDSSVLLCISVIVVKL